MQTSSYKLFRSRVCKIIKIKYIHIQTNILHGMFVFEFELRNAVVTVTIKGDLLYVQCIANLVASRNARQIIRSDRFLKYISRIFMPKF